MEKLNSSLTKFIWHNGQIETGIKNVQDFNDITLFTRFAKLIVLSMIQLTICKPEYLLGFVWSYLRLEDLIEIDWFLSGTKLKITLNSVSVSFR